MMGDALQAALLLAAAVAMGGLIGIERNYHGHVAGFRTHALVSLTSCALMLLVLLPSAWMGAASADVLRTNITRVIQGVMTGIGFLGAGVILKNGLEVRGLTTAAAIWCTAAVGVLVGLGSWVIATITTLIALGVLTAFRSVENKLPVQVIVHVEVRFERHNAPDTARMRALAADHAFVIDELTFALDTQDLFTYRMVLKTRSEHATERLARTLQADPLVRGFDITLRRD
jgi:putative Mg2+ transporter-C (MgtC) family protein